MRLFIGEISIEPKQSLSAWSLSKQNETSLKTIFAQHLTDTFQLPKLSQDFYPILDDDRILDISVDRYRLGGYGFAEVGMSFLPFVLRGKITLAAKIRSAKSGEIVKRASITVKMPWTYYLKAKFTLKSIFGLSTISVEQMEILFLKAVVKLAEEIGRN